jgi:hypothetical protein
MSLTGKSSKSLRKKDLINQKSPAIGIKSLMFAHEATLGDAGFNLSDLNVPTSMLIVGFVQPTVAELSSASLKYYRKNLRLVSVSRGPMNDYLDYTVDSNYQINFTTAFGTALASEIFIGYIDPVVRTGNLVADVEFILETGTLAAGYTDISIGKSFKTNLYPTKQCGAVTLYIDGQIQFRNYGNATAAPAADGNYQEVDNEAGECTLLSMNSTDTADRAYLVISSATTVIRPDGSVLDIIEKQQATIDKLVEEVAVLASLPESDFQVAPTQPVLKQFGDRVIALENKAVTSAFLNAPQTIEAGSETVILNTEAIDTHSAYNVATGVWTCPQEGKYFVSYGVKINAASPYPSQVTARCRKNSSGVYAAAYLNDFPAAGTKYDHLVGSYIFDLILGDTLELFVISNTNGCIADGHATEVYTYFNIYQI